MKTLLTDSDIETIGQLRGECATKKIICESFHIGVKRLNKIWKIAQEEEDKKYNYRRNQITE